MSTNFNSDFAKSNNHFKNFTRRALEEFGVRDIISTESSDDPLSKLLDRRSGVDVVGTMQGEPVFIASRIIEVVPFGSDYYCFSIRDLRLSGAETELSKLKRKIRYGLPTPFYHVQTFVDLALNLAKVGIVRTRELVNFIINDSNKPMHKTKIKRTCDGTKFKLAFWDDLKGEGVDVDIFKFGIEKK